MAAIVTLGDGPGGFERSTSCDRDSSQSRQIQEIASEVLRLRLVQSQHRQLEGQLRAAADKLRALPVDSIFQLRRFLEQGLRPVGGPGTLGGGAGGGVDPESLLGLMECLCVVCNPGRVTRKQDDLLAATQYLLQDPQALIEQMISLPAAQSSQSRRLAPFLLSCDGGWRGHLSEAGQCYETFRSWLSCYYQFSLINSQMQATSEQLAQQERLLEELSRDADGGTGGVGGPLYRPTSTTWRPQNSVRRSSSVQSNESAGSRRSQSPTERSSTAGIRPSPRPGAGPTGSSRLSALTATRESPAFSPLKTAARASERQVRGGSGSHSSHMQRTGAVSSPGRSNSPLQPSSSRTSLHCKDTKVESSPRAPRFGPPLSMSGTLGSARVQARAGAPPPNPSPRVVRQTSTQDLASSRRQNVPAVRARRSPSREHGSTPEMRPGGVLSSKHSGSLSSRVTPLGSRGAGTEPLLRTVEMQRERLLEPPPAPRGHHPDPPEKEPEPEEAGVASVATVATSSRASAAHSPVLERSRSLQSITEPTEAAATPPMSCRGVLQSEVHSARLRTPTQASVISPIGRLHSGSAASTPQQPRPEHRPITSGLARMTRFAAPPSAGSGGTPSGAALRRTQNQHSRSSLQLPSGRRLSPSESATSLRHNDAGSGGTGDRENVQQAPTSGWSLQSSRSTPALDMRVMSSRLPSRDTPNATPRPQTSARVR